MGEVLTCTTTVKAERSGPVILVTTDYSETSDPDASNNKAISAVTVIEAEPTPADDATPGPRNARWALALISLAIGAMAVLRLRRSCFD